MKNLVLDTTTLEVSGFSSSRKRYLLNSWYLGLKWMSHIKVNRNMMTNIEGLYAAGDCAGKPYQLSKAVGEGQIAALHAVEYVDKATSSDKMSILLR